MSSFGVTSTGKMQTYWREAHGGLEPMACKQSEKLGSFVLKRRCLRGSFVISVFFYPMCSHGEDRLLEVHLERVRSNGLMLQQEKF